MINFPKPFPDKWEIKSPASNGNNYGKGNKTVFGLYDSKEEEISSFQSLEKSGKQLYISESIFSKFPALIIIAFILVVFSSCGNDNGHVVGDVAYAPDSTAIAKNKSDSIEKIEIETRKIQFSKEDSANTADSIVKIKNPIRDFN